jgi:uridine phosphorylase
MFKRELSKALSQREDAISLQQSRPLCDAIEWSSNGEIGILGPLIGASAVVLACETLIHSGTEAIALLGAIGGISSAEQTISHGDIIFPRAALSQEGTSPLYGAPETWNTPPSEYQKRLEQAFTSRVRLAPLSASSDKCLSPTSDERDNSQLTSKYGMVWTTDAPMMESAEAIDSFRKRGAIAVDMEFSAVHHLCSKKGIPFAAGFVVSDVFENSWSSGFSRLKNSLSVSALCSSFAEAMLE